MTLSGILDVLLVLLLIGYLGYGYSVGLVRSLFSLAGVAIGAIAAFFAIPLIGSWAPSPMWRLPLVLIFALLLIAAGQSAGAWVGRAIRRQVDRTKLSVLDRVLGAAANVVVTALVAAMIAFGVGSLGVPVLSQSIASSGVLRTIDDLTPGPVKDSIAALRSLVVQEGFPRIINAIGGPTGEIPDLNTDSPELQAAARSVVRITGNAYQCGQNQSGSGFVVAPDRVITNAHVVAGVDEPVVEAPGQGAVVGRVVYFDPDDDLAIIAVKGLDVPPLALTATLRSGTDAVFDGYPLGGPFRSRPATVQSVQTVAAPDIYGDDPQPVEVYSLAAQVQEGNSGGPLLDLSGQVAGVVFAKGANTQDVGYALTMTEVRPVADQAAGLAEPVASGSCINR